MASNKVGGIYVELGANTASFQSDMGKAARVAELEMGKIVRQATMMGNLLGEAISYGVKQFGEMAKASLDAADHLNDLSQRTGVSAEQLSALSYAAKMSGTDTDTLSTGIKKLSENMVDAARGQGASKAAFAALGISVRDANGQLKAQDQVLREVADKFSTFGDGATKTALAVDIFGKSGADLIPMLDGGSKGLAAMEAEARSMGVVLSNETAAAAGEVNDSIDRMTMSTQGMVSQVVAQMLPTLQQVGAQMTATAQDTGFLTNVADGLSFVLKSLVTAAMATKAAFALVGDSIGRIAAAAVAVMSGDFAGAKAIMADTTAADSLSDTLTNIRNLWTGTGEAAAKAGDLQGKALGSVPNYSAPKAGKGGKGGKGGKPAKSGADWDMEMGASIDQWAAEEDAKNAAQLQKQREASAQQIAQLQQTLMSKQMLEAQDYAAKQLALQEAAQLEVINETQKIALLEDLERQHKARIKEMDDAELEQKKANQDRMLNFVGNGLAAIAGKHKAAATAATIVQNREALRRIAIDTRTMATGAYSALAGIPIVGPALGIAAAGAAIAFGAAQAAALGGGIGGSGGSTPSSATATAPAAASVQPAASADDLRQKSTTILQIPANRMLTGRDLVDWLDEALGDGARLTNLRVMAV